MFADGEGTLPGQAPTPAGVEILAQPRVRLDILADEPVQSAAFTEVVKPGQRRRQHRRALTSPARLHPRRRQRLHADADAGFAQVEDLKLRMELGIPEHARLA